MLANRATPEPREISMQLFPKYLLTNGPSGADDKEPSPFAGIPTGDLAAFLRAEYARLEPFRPLLGRVSAQCLEDLARRYQIKANANDVLASAEDFLLALLNRGSEYEDVPEDFLQSTMRAHLIAHYVDLDSQCKLRGAQDRHDERKAEQALLAVDSVLVRATAVAAEELRRIHALVVPPSEVLLAANDALHDLAQEEERGLGEYELERLIADQTVARLVAARATRKASQRRSEF